MAEAKNSQPKQDASKAKETGNKITKVQLKITEKGVKEDQDLKRFPMEQAKKLLKTSRHYELSDDKWTFDGTDFHAK